MATHCAIIEKTEKGYRGIYCHYDGYKEGVGKTLKEYYTDPIKVSKLINLGYISSLGERIYPIQYHTYNDPEKGTTVAYHRDRDELMHAAVFYQTLKEVKDRIDHGGNVYTFINGSWKRNGKSY